MASIVQKFCAIVCLDSILRNRGLLLPILLLARLVVAVWHKSGRLVTHLDKTGRSADAA